MEGKRGREVSHSRGAEYVYREVSLYNDATANGAFSVIIWKVRITYLKRINNDLRMFDTTADRKLEHQHTVGQSSHNNYTVNNSKKVRRQRALDAGERLNLRSVHQAPSSTWAPSSPPFCCESASHFFFLINWCIYNVYPYFSMDRGLGLCKREFLLYV